MAYVNFSETFSGPAAAVARPRADVIAAAPAPDSSANPPAADFTAIEWMVIGLAERDGLASLAAPGPVARAVGGLFGLGTKSRLADDRLEQLRRFAVLVRHHGWRVPTSEVKAFLASYSVAQLETVIASATRRHTLAGRKVPA